MSSMKNLIYELPHELAKYLRLTILGNYEMIQRSQILEIPEIQLWQ